MKISSGKLFQPYPIWIVAIVGTFIAQFAAYKYSDGGFRNDYFRHFYKIVIPFIEDPGKVHLLFANHHASPILHLHQMLNVMVFDNSLRWDAHIGISLFLCVGIALALTTYFNIERMSNNFPMAVSVGIAVIWIITSVSWQPIKWPLIYVSAYFHAIGILLVFIANAYCAKGGSWKLGLIYVSLAIIGVIFHSTFGVMYFIGSAAGVLVTAVRIRKISALIPVIVVILFVIMWFVVILPLFQSERHAALSVVSFITVRYSETPLFIAAFGKAILSGVDGNWLIKSTTTDLPGRYIVLALYFTVGIACVMAMLWSIYSSKQVKIAGMILIAVAVGAIGSLVYRGGDAFPYRIDAPRYVLMYKIGAAAFVWSSVEFFSSFFYRRNEANLNGSVRYISIIVLGVVFIAQSVIFVKLAKNYKNIHAVNGDYELALFMLGNDTYNYYSLKNHVSGYNPEKTYGPVIDWLQENQLNVFSQSYRGTRKLVNYKSGKMVFESHSSHAVITMLKDKNNCYIHTPSDNSFAWNIKLKSEAMGSFWLKYPLFDDSPLRYKVLKGRQSFFGVFPAHKKAAICIPVDADVEFAARVPM